MATTKSTHTPGESHSDLLDSLFQNGEAGDDDETEEYTVKTTSHLTDESKQNERREALRLKARERMLSLKQKKHRKSQDGNAGTQGQALGSAGAMSAQQLKSLMPMLIKMCKGLRPQLENQSMATKLAYKCMDIGEKHHTNIQDYSFCIHWTQLIFLLRLLPFSTYIASMCTLASFICLFVYHVYQRQFAPDSRQLLYIKPKSSDAVFLHQCVWTALLSQLIWAVCFLLQGVLSQDLTEISWYMLTYLCTICVMEMPGNVIPIGIALIALFFTIWTLPITAVPIFIAILSAQIAVCIKNLPSGSLMMQLWQMFGMIQVNYFNLHETTVSSSLWLVPILCMPDQPIYKNFKTVAVGAMTYNIALYFNSALLHIIGIAITAYTFQRFRVEQN